MVFMGLGFLIWGWGLWGWGLDFGGFCGVWKFGFRGF